jgi:hypothetical protein
MEKWENRAILFFHEVRCVVLMAQAMTAMKAVSAEPASPVPQIEASCDEKGSCRGKKRTKTTSDIPYELHKAVRIGR